MGKLNLTDEQQKIVNHLKGPALVFAVAGSGKTTCMVHRIKNLVDKNVFAPHQILATSFNNSAVRDIQMQLKQLGVPGSVECRTLHSLGYQIVRRAAEKGYIDKVWLNAKHTDSARAQLIDKTLVQLSIEQKTDVTNLNIDREDLQNQISIWKANLQYDNVERADIPDAEKSTARQASHEHDQYVYAYQIYERIRRQRKILTFDDMLMMGWELLIQYPDILAAIQSAYQSVIVDEFQDVNYAQYLIIDMITRAHRNYMAIGDDDQCIYEWRGASPRFILDFEKNYQAKVFTISDNFRSSAQQVALANHVIVKNKQRYPKQLSLTRGFDGETHIHTAADNFRAAGSMVKEIKRLLDSGEAAPDEMAVLIRLYSQSAFPEAALIEHQIPYQVVGNDAFYRRSEMIPLIQYLSFARMEIEIGRDGFPDDPKRVAKYCDMFKNIINKPRRYVARNTVDAIVRTARQRRVSAIEILFEQQDAFKRGTQKKIEEFMNVVDRLMPRLKKPAHKTLQWLVDKIEYNDYLQEISGMKEIGLTRVQNVKAMIEFARIKDMKCAKFIDYIREISLNPIPNPRNLPPLKIMTTYRAKGLEWDTVFVPGCNDGVIPCVVTDDDMEAPQRNQLLEAERRLFYVAVTRARKTLHLYHAKDQRISPFLIESDAANMMAELDKLATILRDGKTIYREKTLVQFCRSIGRFHLERYFTHWAKLPLHLKDNITVLIGAIEKKIEQARAEEKKFEQGLKQFQEQRHSYERQLTALEEKAQNSLIVIRKYKSALYQAEEGQVLNFELFDDGDVMAVSDRGLVGVLEFEKMPDFDFPGILWELSSAEVAEIPDERGLLTARFLKIEFDEDRQLSQGLGIRPPEKPSNKYEDFLEQDFIAGVAILKKLLKV